MEKDSFSQKTLPIAPLPAFERLQGLRDSFSNLGETAIVEGHLLESYLALQSAVDLLDSEDSHAVLLLRKIADRVHIFLDAMPVRIAVLDQSGKITFTNQAWREAAIQAGLDWRTVSEGVDYLAVCEPVVDANCEGAARAASEIRRLLNGDSLRFQFTYDCHNADGDQWFVCYGQALRVNSSERAVIIHKDVTLFELSRLAIEETQLQLAHACRVATMGEMATSLAHELNQPLAAIRLYAENCLEDIKSISDEPESLFQKLQLISTLAGQCAHIIDRVRSFVSRQGTSKYTLFDGREALQNVIAIIDYQRKQVGFSLHLDISKVPLWINGNRIQVQQVLLNLVLNAIEAVQECCSADRRIDLSAVALGNNVLFTVHDFGIGISDETEERMFEPFYTTKSNGLGMGLKISRSIVRARCGSLTYESRGACGTIFRVSLPSEIGSS